MLAILFMAVQLTSIRPTDMAEVYYRTDDEASIHVPVSELGRIIDLGYETGSRRLIAYIVTEAGRSVRIWSQVGKQEADIQLPEGVWLRTGVFIKGSLLSAIAVETKSRRTFLATFGKTADSPTRTLELTPLASHDDRALNPDRSSKIREVIVKFGWGPAPRNGFNSSMQALGSSMALNVPYIEDRLAYSDSDGIMCMAWQALTKVFLATRDPGGWHAINGVSDLLLKAVGWRFPADPIQAMSIVVGKSAVAFGLVKWTKSPEPRVVWLSVDQNKAAVTRTKTGYLARQIERFGR
jgi:hypothetical protein